MTRFLILLIAVVLFASCRSTRQIQTAISKRDSSSIVLLNAAHVDSLNVAKSFLRKLDSTSIDYTTFNAKLKVEYTGGDGKGRDVNATIRMIKDSAIWVSANAILGIEAMRVLVTKDSVKLLDKLNKIYTARSIDYLQEVTSLPLNLNSLQELIIGNAVFVDSNVVSYSRGNNQVSFLSIGPWFKNLVTMNADNQLVHSKLDDVNMARSRTAELLYADFDNAYGFAFPKLRRIIVAEKTRLDISLEFKSYEFNQPVSFPFSIPKNYEHN